MKLLTPFCQLSRMGTQASGRYKRIPDLPNSMAAEKTAGVPGGLTMDCMDPEPLGGLGASSRGEKGPGESSPLATGLAG